MPTSNTIGTSQDWLIGEPSIDLKMWAGATGVELRTPDGLIHDLSMVKAFRPKDRLGRLLPVLIPQFLELGAARFDARGLVIPYDELSGIEERGIDAFEGCWKWSPFSIELSSTGWLQNPAFGYFVRFYLGNRPVEVRRRGCFIKRGEDLYRLDRQTYLLLSAIETYQRLPAEAKTGAKSMLHFAKIRGLAEEVGAQLDQYLQNERVLVPARVGLDVIVDDEARITFVPKVDGVDPAIMRDAFLALDDVDDAYSCPTPDGGRIRLVLTEDQRGVFRRMQRIRHVGGAERQEVVRNPYSVFDGVSNSIDIDLGEFGPRVRGIGDFPFVARPFLQRSISGIFDDVETASEHAQRARFDAGLECTYADGSTERVNFASRDQLLRFKTEAEESLRNGRGQVQFGGRSIEVDSALVDSLASLSDRVTSKPRTERVTIEGARRYVLIYTNEDELEYEEDPGSEGRSSDPELPSSLLPDIKLKEHQLEGVAWLQRNFNLQRRGCLLADDMGLGKTLQTLVFLAWLVEKGMLSEGSSDYGRPPWNPILIVAPVILLENEVWINDMTRFFHAAGDIFQPWVTLHGGTLKAFRRPDVAGKETTIGEAALDLEALRKHRVILTNYETVTNYQHSFARMRDHWAVVVTDEAQEYKTPNSKVSHAMKSLAPRFRIACTGTPVETRLLDVWNIFDFLQPGRLLGSSSEFSKRFERSDGDRADKSLGFPNEAQLSDLRATLGYGRSTAFVLRRNKADILRDLPPKVEHKIQCDLSQEQRNWHLDIVGRARTEGRENHPFALISQLMRVYQHPSLVPSFEPPSISDALLQCPKLHCLLDLLKKVRSSSEKALIFTRSLDMQQLLKLVLDDQFAIDAEIVNGATPRKGATRAGHATRQSILRRFREGSGFDVLILSPEVAGIGLTLVEANHVFHYGRWWNPAKEAQATDRAYRIGQTKKVNVYQLIASDPHREFSSFDEKLDSLIERRRELAADFLAPMPSDRELEAELLKDVLDQGEGSTHTKGSSKVHLVDPRLLLWDRFEALIALLWERQGAKVILTPKAGDEGIDVIGIRDRTIELIQCKHTMWEATVEVDVIGEIIQAFDGYRTKRFRGRSAGRSFRCVLVTNGTPTRQCRKVAEERDIAVVGGAELMKLLATSHCTILDVEAAASRRLATMRDVQAMINCLLA